MARLIDADALKKEWSMADKCEDCPQDTRRCQFDQDFTRMDICEMIDEAPTIGGWISVEDELPNVAGWYLVFYNGCKMQVAFFNGKKWPFDNHYHKVTHWRPLPEPPEEES